MSVRSDFGMIAPRPCLVIEQRGWQLFRLTDDEFCVLARFARPVLLSQGLELRLQLSPARVSLARALIALETLFGPSSSRFDDDKGSFSFRLLLRLGPDPLPALLVTIFDCRGNLTVVVAMVAPTAQNYRERRTYHDLDPNVVSRDDLDWFVTFVHVYLLRVGSEASLKGTRPFFRRIEASRIIYGHDGTREFEICFDDLPGEDTDALYRARLAELSEKYGHPEMGHWGKAGAAEVIAALTGLNSTSNADERGA